jgi:hypothetical protein
MGLSRNTLLLVPLVAALAACAAPVHDPRSDETFGEAVLAARERHKLFPQGAQPRWDGAGMDGTAAVESVMRYWDSFRAPPPTFVIINAGGGTK